MPFSTPAVDFPVPLRPRNHGPGNCSSEALIHRTETNNQKTLLEIYIRKQVTESGP
jgi:hypothetical protein